MHYFSNKTVLVTGATGLIGSNLVHRLMSFDDVNVIVVGRSEEKLKKCFSEYLCKLNFSYIAHDISNPLVLDKKVDLIFHAAGPMEAKIITTTPLNVILPNIIGTKNCFDFALEQRKCFGVSCRVVVFSSVTVYSNNSDKDKTVTEKDTDITEVLDAPKASYSQSKRMSEVIANAYKKQNNVDMVIARFSTVYGNTFYKPDSAFYEFIKKALSGEDIIINSSRIPRRDNIYIDDAVSALLTIAEKGVSGEAYNISSNGDLGNYAGVDEIANEIANTVNKHRKAVGLNDVKIAINFDINDRQPGLKLDNHKLKALGWHVDASLQDGIAKTLQLIVDEKQGG